jgi:lysozyme
VTTPLLPDPALPWPIPRIAVALIAEREGCRLKAYRCPAGVWTCGFGETEGITPETQWTQAEADERFCLALGKYSGAVQALCTQAPGPNQLGAMTSLAYNIGLGGFRASSVLRAHNRGDWQGAARAFALWNKATIDGTLQVLRGLTARRAAEAALYLTPEADDAREPMPQIVQAESTVAASPIIKGGATTVGAGVVAALAEARDALGPLGAGLTAAKDFASTVLGIPPSWVLPAVLIGAGIVVVRWRLKQRVDGWC